MISKSFIELVNVTKHYSKGKQQVSVINNLNLSISEGEFVAIMGPSGSGKSTLLNLLGGLDKASSGKVLIDGSDISGLSNNQLTDWRADYVGFIYQFYNLIPVLNARGNVALPLLLKSLSTKEREKKADAALALVGLSERKSHYPRELSGGQEQRVAIARAIVTGPAILLCDEPTGDLDRTTADEIMALLKTLNEKFNNTIIMVTHDIKAAKTASRTIDMEEVLKSASSPA